MKTMTCACGKTLFYNHRYQCYECKCGKCYNAIGSELAPRTDWQDEYDEDD